MTTTTTATATLERSTSSTTLRARPMSTHKGALDAIVTIDYRELRRREHHEADIVIVGAGIAGCAAAVAFGKQGRSVILLEKSLKEPDRIVGELLQPGGVEALEKLGLRGASCVLHIHDAHWHKAPHPLTLSCRLSRRHRRDTLLRLPSQLPRRTRPHPLPGQPDGRVLAPPPA